MSGKLSGTGGGHNRRNFLKTGFVAAGATAVGAVLSEHGTLVAAAQSSGLNAGDVAILQFLAAGELLEVDFWTQYNELGGIPDSEVSGGTGNAVYTERLRSIESGFPAIHSRQHRRRDQSRDVHQCVSRFQGCRASKPGSVQNARRKQSHRIERQAAADEPDAVDDRQQLVDALSQQHEQS